MIAACLEIRALKIIIAAQQTQFTKDNVNDEAVDSYAL